MTTMRGNACGKVILCGEHAVVHGVPALAVGIDRGARAEATPVAGPSTLQIRDWNVNVSTDDTEGPAVGAAFRALIEVSGRPLIDYALAFAAAARGGRRVVVGGFHHADVAARVAAVAPDAVLCENPEFRKGNLLSMRAGLPAIDRGLGFLMMNTDHIYRPSIAPVVAAACRGATEITGFCAHDRQLGPDDMKVALDGERRIADAAKTLAQWDCGYVGMTFVPAARLDDYLAASERVLATRGEASHVEAILVELAKSGAPPHIADISGHGWLEIDEPHERDHAERVLAAERWWS